MKQPLRNPYSRLASLFADPLHIAFIRLLAKCFGTFRQKAYMNVLERNAYAFGVIRGVGFAERLNIPFVSLVEFGVASGRGLDLLIRYAEQVEAIRTRRVRAVAYGFDTGNGMPESHLWEDHPEEWSAHDFAPVVDLKSKFADRAVIMLGDIAEAKQTTASPVVFASIDVDYYTSSLDALEYLYRCAAPFCSVYCDDVAFSTASDLRGQLLAIRTFNARHKGECCVTPDRTLPGGRLIRHAAWYNHMYVMHRKVT